MALKDVIGQEKALKILFGTLKRERVPSAFLFSGDSGIGKRTAALNYSKALNCLQPIDFDCCDSCMSCRKIDAGTHPDVHIITLENVEETLSLEKRKSEDKNRYEYPIDAVRKIEEFLYLSPNEGKRKVVVIDDAETMNSSAANAFLKTLEEPPPDSLIILVSSNPDALPDTIRSRCTNIRFHPLPVRQCRSILERHLNEESIERVSAIIMGRPGLALSLDILKESDNFFSLTSTMLGGEIKEGWADKSEIKKWLDYAMIFLRDTAVVLAVGGERERILGSRLNFGAGAGIDNIIETYGKLQQLMGMLDFNLNKSITWNYAASIMRKLN